MYHLCSARFEIADGNADGIKVGEILFYCIVNIDS